jgi:hypothetical protein
MSKKPQAPKRTPTAKKGLSQKRKPAPDKEKLAVMERLRREGIFT